MKNRQNFSIYPLLIMIVVLVIASSCEKDDNEPSSGDLTNGKTTAEFNSGVTYGTMTDQDGNVYKTVTIGTQTWMAENLRTTKYNDGTAIPNVTDDDEWKTSTKGAYCNCKNTTSTDTIATYGRLYNWYAVTTGKLAPTGWHVATDADWTNLTTYLGGESVAGGKLRETGTTHWHSPNTGATNETGFTAIPGGQRFILGSFNGYGYFGYWWSATDQSSSYAWRRQMNYDHISVYREEYLKNVGHSVRCVRD